MEERDITVTFTTVENDRRVSDAIREALSKLGVRDYHIDYGSVIRTYELLDDVHKRLDTDITTFIGRAVDSGGVILAVRSLREKGVESVRDLFAFGRYATKYSPNMGSTGKRIERLDWCMSYEFPTITWRDVPKPQDIAILYRKEADVPLFVLGTRSGGFPPRLTMKEFLRNYDEYQQHFHASSLKKDAETFLRDYRAARRSIRR